MNIKYNLGNGSNDFHELQRTGGFRDEKSI